MVVPQRTSRLLMRSLVESDLLIHSRIGESASWVDVSSRNYFIYEGTGDGPARRCALDDPRYDAGEPPALCALSTFSNSAWI